LPRTSSLFRLSAGRRAPPRELEHAFEDLGVLVVDYRHAPPRFLFDHGLGDFVREFDAGRYPGLVAEK
jgi:hypothetical protein